MAQRVGCCGFGQARAKDFERFAVVEVQKIFYEPRGEAWTTELVRGLCDELNLVHGGDPLQRRPARGDFAYFGLHGRTGYRYRHGDADLREIAATAAPYDTAYCLFNNMTMLEDADRLRRLLAPPA